MFLILKWFEKSLTISLGEVAPRRTVSEAKTYEEVRAALQAGEKRLRELIKKYGKDVISDSWKQLLDYSERLMRAEIDGIPEGRYEAEDYIDYDPLGDPDKPLVVKVAVTVNGSEMVVDYTGSSPQARGGGKHVIHERSFCCLSVNKEHVPPYILQRGGLETDKGDSP